MMPAQRETLREMARVEEGRARYEASHLVEAVQCHGWQLQDDPLDACYHGNAYWVARRAAAHGLRAIALRAALVERICGTCHHGERLRMMDGVERIWCHIHHSHRPGDDGCIKGWQAREGEGGEK